MCEIKYKRILLKLSGEALSGEEKNGISKNVLNNIAEQIKELVKLGIEVAVVIGGGNFWRGKQAQYIERNTSDYMGMLATTMNGLALQNALENIGVEARLQAAIEMREVAEPVVRRKAIDHLKHGRVVIFSCGTGNPFFTTDTTAALRAAEIDAQLILVAKTIDGVYSADPKYDKSAIKFDTITYSEFLNKELKVLDSTAIALCKDNNIPLIVFAMEQPENIVKAIRGEKIGTIIN